MEGRKMRAEGVLWQMVSVSVCGDKCKQWFSSTVWILFICSFSLHLSLSLFSLSSRSLALSLSFTAAADFSFHLNQPLLHAQSPVSPFFLL